MCESIQVEVPVAEEGFQYLATFQEKADIKIVGHAYAAMHLDGFSSDIVRRFTQFCFDQAGQFGNIPVILVQGVQPFEYDGLALLDITKHHGGTMLQGLETADGHAKLLALLQVLKCALKGFLLCRQQACTTPCSIPMTPPLLSNV